MSYVTFSHQAEIDLEIDVLVEDARGVPLFIHEMDQRNDEIHVTLEDAVESAIEEVRGDLYHNNERIGTVPCSASRGVDVAAGAVECDLNIAPLLETIRDALFKHGKGSDWWALVGADELRRRNGYLEQRLKDIHALSGEPHDEDTNAGVSPPAESDGRAGEEAAPAAAGEPTPTANAVGPINPTPVPAV